MSRVTHTPHMSLMSSTLPISYLPISFLYRTHSPIPLCLFSSLVYSTTVLSPRLSCLSWIVWFGITACMARSPLVAALGTLDLPPSPSSQPSERVFSSRLSRPYHLNRLSFSGVFFKAESCICTISQSKRACYINTSQLCVLPRNPSERVVSTRASYVYHLATQASALCQRESAMCIPS